MNNSAEHRRTAIYTRVSTTEQVEGTSLDDQVRRTEHWAGSQDWKIVDRYVDDGVSGAKPLAERPEGARLLADIEAGDVDAVIVLKVDRFTRSLRHGAAVLAEWAQDRGDGEPKVAFAAVEENFDTATATGRLMLNLLMLFADFERERIAERMADGRRATVLSATDEQGRSKVWVGGALPYGYVTAEDGTIVEDPEHGATVRRVFELRALGESTTAIARKLQAEGRTPRLRAGAVNPFSGDLVVAILGTAAYMTGEVERKLSKSDASPTIFVVPTIVTPDEYKAAHVERKGRKRIANAGKRHRRYALSERISHLHRDGTTSGMYGNARTTRNVQGQKREQRFYRCDVARASSTAPASCDGLGVIQGQTVTSVPADVIEAAVLRFVLDRDEAEWVAMLEAADRALLAEEGAGDLDEARARLARLKTKKARYVDAWADEKIDDAEYEERIAKVDAEADVLEAAIERAEDREAQRATINASIAELLTMKVEDTGDRDPNADKISPAQFADELRQALARTLAEPDRYGRTDPLPDWAVETCECWVAMLGLEVTVAHPGPDGNPRRPRVTVNLNPASVLALQETGSSASRTGCRAGCGRANLR